jgi:hypothetical protein
LVSDLHPALTPLPGDNEVWSSSQDCEQGNEQSSDDTENVSWIPRFAVFVLCLIPPSDSLSHDSRFQRLPWLSSLASDNIPAICHHNQQPTQVAWGSESRAQRGSGTAFGPLQDPSKQCNA